MLKRSALPGTLLTIGLLCAGSAPVKAEEMATTDMLVNTCIACHGANGVSAGPATPSLAGLTRNYLIGAMLAYKFHDDAGALEKAVDERGEAYEDVPVFPRYGTIMPRIAPGYTVEEIEVIADYFSSWEPQIVRQRTDSAMASQGRKLHNAKCEKCHENGGRSTEDDVGLLAGQWMPYLHYTLQDYHDGKRQMPRKMKTKLKELYEDHGEKGIESLLHYYGSAE